MSECLVELEPVVSHNQSSDSNIHAIHDAPALSLSHLPHIRLSPFDRIYAAWENLRDRFTALIIKNKDITDFARMHFLASSLKGRALECISSIFITADNFPIAWQAFTVRFENKRRLLASHLSTLFGLSTVSRESASELQILCDKINIAMASLRNLDRTPSDLWNDILVHIMSQKLDSATRKAWNLHTSNVDTPPTYDDLTRFLINRIRALKECSSNSSSKSASKSANSSRVNVATASTNSPLAYPLCKARHYLSVCPEFIAKNPNQRREIVKRFKRCFNCLSHSYSTQECKSKYTYRSCSKKHHTMLHADSDSGSSSSASTPQLSVPSQSTAPPGEITSLLASATPGVRSQILLATAWVKVKVASDRALTVRALLDQGSEATIISEHLAQSLRAKRRMPISISAVGGVHVGTVQHAASILISPRDSDTPPLSTTALILNSLTSYAPKRVTDLTSLAHLADLTWADADPTSSDPIHIIIGADIYNDLIYEGVRKGKIGQAVAQNSAFGWVISGPLLSTSGSSRSPHGNSQAGRSSANLTVLHCMQLQSLTEEIRRFWEIEELPRSRNLTPQDEQCEFHFCDTHSRQDDGRYIVRLPFKQSPPLDIGQSRLTAERMFNSLTRRFRSNSDLEREYDEFMHEYEVLGHMRLASAIQESRDQRVYIPHHSVFREDSATTHLRVVFNASSTTSNGSLLNDHLLAGPKLQTKLPAILLQWRHLKFVYKADSRKCIIRF